MPTFVMLNKLTDQGTKGIKDTTKRHAATKKNAAKYGIKVKEFFWTLGSFDVIGGIRGPPGLSGAGAGTTVIAFVPPDPLTRSAQNEKSSAVDSAGAA